MKTKYATNYICRQHRYSKDFRYTFSLRRIIPAGHGPFRFVSENLETVRTCCSNILLHFQLLYRKFLQGSLHQVAIFLCLVQLCIKFKFFLFYCCVASFKLCIEDAQRSKVSILRSLLTIKNNDYSELILLQFAKLCYKITRHLLMCCSLQCPLFVF